MFRRSRAWIALHALVILLPLFGMITGLGDLPRYGVELPTDFPALNLHDWIQEKIQPAFQAWFEARIGFRTVMVRTDNSLQTELLKETQPGSYVLIANEGTYFSADDVRYMSMQARDLPFVKARIERLTAVLGSVHRKLAARGKTMVVIIAASKSDVYPETVPDRWRRDSHVSDEVHDALRGGLEKNGVPFGDAHTLFAAVPKEERGLIFTRTGRHWTLVGACWALREALKDSPLRPTCEYEMRTVERSDQLDFDLYRLQNIWGGDVGRAQTPITLPTTGTPAANTPLAERPRALFAGTSFLWMLADVMRPLIQRPISIFYNTTFFDIGNGQRIGSVQPNTPLWDRYVLEQDLYVFDILETFAHYDEQFVLATELDRRLQ